MLKEIKKNVIFLIIKDIIDEVYSDFNKIGMLVVVPKCKTRCWEKCGLSPDICQNYHLNFTEKFNINNEDIINRYLENPLTKCIIFGGLDGFDSIDEILIFLEEFRKISKDDVVIYTGKELEDIEHRFNDLAFYKNIYVKYGHYNPNLNSIKDELTGVTLASENQKFIKINS